jgi:hypothetical protein
MAAGLKIIKGAVLGFIQSARRRTPQSQSRHRQAAALGRFADFFAKGSVSDPDGNHCPLAGRHDFAPRHWPLVWRCSLKRYPVKPINKSEILKAGPSGNKLRISRANP